LPFSIAEIKDNAAYIKGRLDSVTDEDLVKIAASLQKIDI
jgi:hypothetical protein